MNPTTLSLLNDKYPGYLSDTLSGSNLHDNLIPVSTIVEMLKTAIDDNQLNPVAADDLKKTAYTWLVLKDLITSQIMQRSGLATVVSNKSSKTQEFQSKNSFAGVMAKLSKVAK